jgi:ABC-2 type transport system permease protein
MTYVAIATVGLLVPLSCMFAGIGVIVDRETGARRDLLAAPIPRSIVVVGNLAVALVVAGLQVVVLLGAAALRGADFVVTVDGMAWFIGATTLFAITMYGAAELLANRVASQEEYVGALPAIAIVPWFVAGSLFPLDTLPAWLAAVAKFLPLTHALALMRYGLTDSSVGLHQIWGMSDPTTMAALSLSVVALFAIALFALATRVFTRTAVQ